MAYNLSDRRLQKPEPSRKLAPVVVDHEFANTVEYLYVQLRKHRKIKKPKQKRG